MVFSEVLSKMGLLFLILSIGFIANKCGILDEEANRSLTKIILNVAQPGMMLYSILNARENSSGTDVGFIFLMSLVLMVLLMGMSYLFPVILRSSKKDRGLFRFMTFIPNTSFLGFPMSEAFFPGTGLFYATIYNIPACIAQYSIGILMIAGTANGKIQYKKVLNPTLITSCIALVMYLLDIRLPGFVMNTASTIGNICVPGVMLILGSSLAGIAPKSLFNNLQSYIFTILKMIVSPALAFFILKPFISNQVLLGTMVLMAAMPPAANTTMFSIEYNADVDVASRNVMLNTILCLVTTPIIMMLLFS